MHKTRKITGPARREIRSQVGIPADWLHKTTRRLRVHAEATTWDILRKLHPGMMHFHRYEFVPWNGYLEKYYVKPSDLQVFGDFTLVVHPAIRGKTMETARTDYIHTTKEEYITMLRNILALLEKGSEWEYMIAEAKRKLEVAQKKEEERA